MSDEELKAYLLRRFRESLKFGADEYGTSPYDDESMGSAIMAIYSSGYVEGFWDGFGEGANA